MEARGSQLFQSSGDLLVDRRYGFAIESCCARGSGRRDRCVAADRRTGAELCLRMVCARRSARGFERPFGRARGIPARARRRPDDRHGAGLRLARLDAGCQTRCRSSMCVRCLISMRRASMLRWRGSPTARPRCCLRRSRTIAIGAGGDCGSARCLISAAAPGLQAPRSGRCATGWSVSICRRR